MKALVLVAVMILAVTTAHAQGQQYSYQGLPFNNFSGTACPPVCSLSGSFTTAAPLPDSLYSGLSSYHLGKVPIAPVDFSFTDGLTVFNPADTSSTLIAMQTNASGNIYGWSIYLTTTAGQVYDSFATGGTNSWGSDTSADSSFTTYANVSNGGIQSAPVSLPSVLPSEQWSRKPVSVPEPSTVSMMLMGLAGLFLLAKLSGRF